MAWRDPWETVDRANALRGQQEMQGIQALSALQGMQTNALQRQQLQQGIADEQATRDAFMQSGGDQSKLMQLLQQRGLYKQAQAQDKALLDRRAAEANISKAEAEAAVKNAGLFRDTVATINDQPGWDAFRNSPAMKGRNLPEVFSPELKDALVMESKSYIAQRTPKYEVVDIGGKKLMVDMNPFTNPAIRGTQFDKTMTPGEVATDARGREANRIAAGQLGVAQGSLSLSRERFNFEQNNPPGQYDPERGVVVNTRTAQARPAMMGDSPLGPREKLTDTQKKELASIESQQNIVRAALKAVEETPTAFGMVRGLATMSGPVSESVAGRFDSQKESETRAYVFNVVSKAINERAGAAQTTQELARLRSFLPAETDNATQVKNKLNAFNDYLENSRAGYDRPQTSGPRPQQPGAPKVPKIASDAEYNALPSGATYIDPNGVTRRKK